MTTTYDYVRPNSGSHWYTHEYIQTGSVEQKNGIF